MGFGDAFTEAFNKESDLLWQRKTNSARLAALTKMKSDANSAGLSNAGQMYTTALQPSLRQNTVVFGNQVRSVNANALNDPAYLKSLGMTDAEVQASLAQKPADDAVTYRTPDGQTYSPQDMTAVDAGSSRLAALLNAQTAMPDAQYQAAKQIYSVNPYADISAVAAKTPDAIPALLQAAGQNDDARVQQIQGQTDYRLKQMYLNAMQQPGLSTAQRVNLGTMAGLSPDVMKLMYPAPIALRDKEKLVDGTNYSTIASNINPTPEQINTGGNIVLGSFSNGKWSGQDGNQLPGTITKTPSPDNVNSNNTRIIIHDTPQAKNPSGTATGLTKAQQAKLDQKEKAYTFLRDKAYGAIQKGDFNSAATYLDAIQKKYFSDPDIGPYAISDHYAMNNEMGKKYQAKNGGKYDYSYGANVSSE